MTETNFDFESGHEALVVRGLCKDFGGKANAVRVLDGVDFSVSRGEFVGLMGPSGSGKTTLLNCVSTIDAPTSGEVWIDGQNIVGLKSRAIAAFRRERLGFVFQDFNLLDTLTGYDNISLALTIKGKAGATGAAGGMDARIRRVAGLLGVADILDKYPRQMSGGQKQRIAAARAIVADPALVLADEPTGALDSKSAAALLLALEDLNRELSTTILMVTHDPTAASYSNRVIFVRDGQVYKEIHKGTRTREQFFEEVLELIAEFSADAPKACGGA